MPDRIDFHSFIGGTVACLHVARAPGWFGASSDVAGREVFWGDDRLEDALASCAGADRAASARED